MWWVWHLWRAWLVVVDEVESGVVGVWCANGEAWVGGGGDGGD